MATALAVALFLALQGAAVGSPAVAAEAVHVVRMGETLTGIGARLGISPKKLAEWNRLADMNRIYSGQRLRLTAPARAPTRATAPAQARERAATQTAAVARTVNREALSSAAPAKLVALTFNGGPEPLLTSAIAKALEAAGVRGSFFLQADRAETYAALVRRLAAAGHEIDSYGWDEPPQATAKGGSPRVSAAAGAAAALRRVSGQPVSFYRPGGHYPGETDRHAAEGAGQTLALWANVVGRPRAVAADAKARLYDGVVLALDGTDPATVESLPALLNELRKNGYRPATLVEVMRRGAP